MASYGSTPKNKKRFAVVEIPEHLVVDGLRWQVVDNDTVPPTCLLPAYATFEEAEQECDHLNDINASPT